MSGKQKFVGRTIIPAQPGYSLVYLDKEEGQKWTAMPPVSIIAWRIHTFADPQDDIATRDTVWPVTVDELFEQPYVIIEPSGRVIDQLNAEYDSLEDALVHRNSRAD